MIGYIKGVVEEVEEECLVLDRDGMGFRIFVPGKLLSDVRTGDSLKIYTYLNVKEDLLQLFGFLSKDDLSVFKLLLSVNGIGPKAALGILSGLTADELRFAVLGDDVATLSKAPGIGKKTAQKVILELKDKLSLQDAFEQKLSHNAAGEKSCGGAQDDAVAALTALGYSAAEALGAVRKAEITEDMDTEMILKAALKHMF
ncbi:MAG: Holliday junction branch migration protein RuvA [Lachnospiraceae bacterium]|nr:Holliday junction branch migration protein RuvA [Lachnospiraceae bacterium]